MEKYLVIIILVVLVYYLFNCWVENKINNILKTKEGFAETTGGGDVASSINTLSQIANDLQTGKGLKVPGVLNILGALNTDGDINTKGAINAKSAINAKGGINIDGDINVGGNINLKKRLFIGETNMEWGSIISVKGGQKEGGYFDFLNETGSRQCYLMGKPDGAYFSENLRINKKLFVGEKNRDILRELDILSARIDAI